MDFKPGFRLSVLDRVVLVIGSAIAIFCSITSLLYGLIVVFVIGHFFLFCNVVRMSRIPELIWAGTFLLLAGSSFTSNVPSWPVTFLLAFCLTLFLVFLETRKPSYHGLFWEKINPELPEWFQKERGKSTRQQG